MSTVSLRNRYLAALGISGSMLSACSSTEPGGTTPTATTTADGTATAAPTDVAFWQPTVFPPPPEQPVTDRPPLGMPSCPEGKFCVSEANAAGSTMAPAPFAKCATQVEDPEKQGMRTINFDQEQTERERTKTKDACCYQWVIQCPGGRPLMVAGAARLAEPTASQAWLHAAKPERSLAEAMAALAPGQRAALARHYATEAAYEHASVAAFARVSLALLAVGAPAALVADTHRAALDEIRHAEAMYRLASTFGGESVGPGSLSLEGARLSASLIELAAEAFIEGCVGEVAAGLVLREEAARAADATTGDLLASLASDEERHAELAWRTVSWALEQDAAAIRPMLEDKRATVELELDAELPDEGAALPFVTSARERITIRKRAIRDVVLPCLDALLASVA